MKRLSMNFAELGRFRLVPAAVVALWVAQPMTARGAGDEQAFASPQEVVRALGDAVNATDRSALSNLFGTGSRWVTNPDPVQGAQELAEFVAAFNGSNRLVRISEDRLSLEVGRNGWPFPIPIVRQDSLWRFDSAAGAEEIRNRRIGRNELEVLGVLRAYVDAQRDYASQDRDGDDVLEYAQTIWSAPGQRDGLYWPTDLDGALSPLGPMVAHAQGEGYYSSTARDAAGPQPFHGYLFKILKSQGKHAPGGKYDYVINGNMIGGFAMVAWPAEYGESGIMTFLVNQQGRVYQRDLGPGTSRAVRRMTRYDPDPAWHVSPD